ncbi:MAG TPA: FHA domain-containing protein [Vicinamibacteria bacterium]|nr:FHA domain-containing protein [Vicinamibacteria bacterium]
MPKLIVNPTSSNRREIPLARTTILTIGRDPSNDLVLPDAMVSRRHAVIEQRGNQFFLRDCSSANGSVVNGDRVSERGLRDGDLVAIGSMRLLYRDEPLEAGAGGKVVPHPSAAPLSCPSCGGEYRRGDLFCRDCGKQVAQPSGPPKTVCASCGTAVALPARFCSACGGSLAPGGQRVEGAGEVKQTGAKDTQPLPVVSPEPSAPRAAGSMAMAPEREAAAPQAQPVPAADTPPAGGVERRVAPERRAERDRRAERPAPLPPEPADFASRLAAFVVDAVFVLSGQVILVAPAGWYWWVREAPRTPSEVSFLPVLASATLVPLAFLLGALYHVYFWSVKGATPGKELLDLRVETEEGVSPLPLGRAALRVFGYLLSAASLGIGFLMVAFQGSGLHDRISSTRVMKGTRR